MIKMIAGVYGMPVKKPDGRIMVKGVGPDDGAFTLDPEREAELVKKGVARFVEVPAPFAPVEPAETDAEEAEEINEPEPLDEMTAKELREYGKSIGLTLRVGMSKPEMVTKIQKHLEDSAEPETDGSELDCEEEEAAEDVPVFDASEAVN